MFQKLSLRFKLFLLISFLSALSVIVGFTGYTGQKTVISKFDNVASSSLPNVHLTDQMLVNFLKIRIALRTLGLPHLSKDESDRAIRDVKEAMADYEVANKKYVAVPFVAGEQALYDNVAADWVKFQSVGQRVLELQATPGLDAQEKMLEIFHKDCPDAAKAYNMAIDHLIAFHEKNAAAWVTGAKDAASAYNNLSRIIILVGLALSFTIGFIFSHSVVTTVKNVTEDLISGSHQVTSAATQITASSTVLSQSASKQASSLQETVATMEELTSMVQLNSMNAKEASRMSVETREIATRGEAEILSLVSSIKDIASDSKKIEDITSVIDDIAFQTNLLALNAAVEAARAGEQGRGFAVVADAVRNLAQRSASAAKDISVLIQGSVAKIEDGSRRAHRGGEVLTEIVRSVKKVSELNNEIAGASEEQANGISQIGRAMNQLDQVTQANASGAEETSAASGVLTEETQKLEGSVVTLRGLIDGRSSRKAA